MPPFTPVKSKAQSRLLFAKARRGDGISLADAKGKTRAADFDRLPERVVARSTKRKPKRAVGRARRR